MASRFTSVLVLLVLFSTVAFAQQIYKWKDKKGQWHFTDTPPAEVKAEQVKGLDIGPKSAPQTTVPTDQLERSQPGSSSQKIVVPFTREGNSIIVQGIVNGRENDTVAFIMDTGADLTAIPRAMARRLNFDPAKSDPFPIWTVGDALNFVPMIEINKLNVGGAEVKHLSVLITGLGDKGLLGMDFLSNFQVNINYAQNELVLEALTSKDGEPSFTVWQERFRFYYGFKRSLQTRLSKFSDSRLQREVFRSGYSEVRSRKQILDRWRRWVDRKIYDLERRASRAGVPRKFWK